MNLENKMYKKVFYGLEYSPFSFLNIMVENDGQYLNFGINSNYKNIRFTIGQINFRYMASLSVSL